MKRVSLAPPGAPPVMTPMYRSGLARPGAPVIGHGPLVLPRCRAQEGERAGPNDDDAEPGEHGGPDRAPHMPSAASGVMVASDDSPVTISTSLRVIQPWRRQVAMP